MTSTMPLLLILLVVLVGSFYYIVQAEGGWDELPRLMERIGIKTDKILNPKSEILNKSKIYKDETSVPAIGVPEEYVSGDSRFSQGTCRKDSDCFVGGCAGEACGSEAGLITTCEFGEGWPNEQKFACGCIKGVCGWRSK